jgi:two-component system alkaline phosphatase synthesis response regulator PhoP
MNESVLLIEDEEALRTTLGDRLRREGFHVEEACDGHAGLEMGINLPFDLIILDLMLPLRSGFDICRDIRQTGVATPILILTARGDTVDKVIGLKLGADDYVTKPFEAAELLARVEALLRRAPARSRQGLYLFGTLSVDLRRLQVIRDDQPIYLTSREFQLLGYLVEHAGEAVSRADLLGTVWGYDARTFTRTVDVHIASLRQKLETDPRHPELIQTVTGVGYRFRRPE